jgi:hypothetical protein
VERTILSPVPPGSGRPVSALEGLAIGVYLFGVYTGIHLLHGEMVVVPYVVCGLVAPYFTFRALSLLSRKHVRSILALALVTMVGIVLAPSAVPHLGERLKGLVYLFYSLWIAFTVFLLLRSWPPGRTARLFGWLVVVLITGAALESYMPGVRQLSDAFRQTVYRSEYLYTADARDIRLFGAIRPKVLAEEPSYLALFFVLSLYSWFSLSSSRRRHALFVVGLTAAILLIRSPIILIGLPLAILTELFGASSANQRASIHRGKRAPRGRGPNIVLFLVLGTALVVVLAATILQRRIEQLLTVRDLSTLGRIVAPVLIGLRVLHEYPFWGVGIAGHEAMLQEIAGVFAGFGVRVDDPTRVVNAFWLFVTYYGILGSALFCGLFWRFMRQLGVRQRLYSVACVIAFTQGMGAFVGMRMWFFAFVVLLVGYFGSRLPSEAVSGLGASPSHGVRAAPTA